MTQDRYPPHSIHTHPPFTGDVNIDYRARLALVEREATERRILQLAEQVATHNTPEQRIRAWERLHELDLPRKAIHPLIRIIAAQTHLTLDQVRDEQRRRLTPAQPTSAISVLPA